MLFWKMFFSPRPVPIFAMVVYWSKYPIVTVQSKPVIFSLYFYECFLLLLNVLDRVVLIKKGFFV